MRVDKYLWCIRYFKTRSIATKACKEGKVRVNGDIIKPSREIYPTDKITVRKNQVNYELVVLDTPKSRLGAKLVDIYRKDVTPTETLQKLDLLKYSKDYYRKKGAGRPTKKDRRDIDDWFEEPSNNDSEE
ncbi:RNA-binding S4 domain-containing protein [Aquimarina sp. MMG015]|uniref:RNA-binding S4 domain-containing protein n=1 Tax=Aquimarina TaxID=290174 RepID=UPI000402E471|nr:MULTISPECIES: S4 domain-containing protein [Aquimarina]AXT56014.1 RNA-binding S4 domain-containing protein [Aquimarina sp. AD1]MBQ4803900.1 RNA-binding S4 domain-containing protein [Aquimarina sp. MMG015]RKN37318.1 RNA-binding S4 domain-containing protein [Aquimarina sp. AD1]